jgi:hypothetical protein
MSAVSRFVDEDAHFREVPGCPLRGVREGRGDDDADEAACARCRYNVLHPQRATIGCTVRTPAGVIHDARRRAPEALDRELGALRGEGSPVHGALADRWLALGTRWLELVAEDDDAGHELGSVIVRFAQAARLGDVEILR